MNMQFGVVSVLEILNCCREKYYNFHGRLHYDCSYVRKRENAHQDLRKLLMNEVD